MEMLAVRSLEKSFGRVRAVRGISLTVERGQVYGLLGPNGSGKTTTMACALGLLRPDAGEARILGEPSSRIHRTRGRVAASFDDSTLVRSLSVHRNLEYARRLLGHGGGRSVDEALELVGLADKHRQSARGLSLGQSRRLSIARVLLGSPELVVMDEPLSGLDTVGVLEVLGLFRRLRDAGVTLVVSSHRMHEMERAVTHVGIILDGEVVRESSLQELLGGGRETLLLAVEPLERARGLLSERGVAFEEAGQGELRVHAPLADAADLNRALVQAGVEVSRLVPERATLHAVFESLVRRTTAVAGEVGA